MSDPVPLPSLADLSRQVAGVANDVVARARTSGREDLAQLVAATAARWSDPQVTVVVAGEIGVGKSSLVSELVGRTDLLPASSEPTTGVVTTVSAGASGAAVAAVAHLDDRDEPLPIATEELALWVGVDGERQGSVARVDVTVADPATGPVLVLVDTPGVAGPTTSADRLVLALLARADVLLFVTDADAPVGRAELDFLEQARGEVGTCVVALSRIDRFRGWPTIRDDSATILERYLGHWAPAAVGVSSTLAAAASEAERDGDAATAAALRAEAGIDQVRAHLLELAQGIKHVRLGGLLLVIERVLAELGQPAEQAEEALAASPEELADALSERRREHAELKTRGTAVLSSVGDQVAALREQLGIDLRRMVAEVTLDHEERLLNPKVDADEVLDAMEHDLRAAQLRFTAGLDADLEALRDRLTASLAGSDSGLAAPAGEEEAERARRAARSSGTDNSLRLRIAAAIASAGGGTVMMGLSVGATSGGGHALRSGLMGVSMMLGGVVATSGVRQTKQQKVVQTVRAQARAILDEWQAVTLARARTRVLAAQRELEAALRDAVRGQLADLEAEVRRLQEAQQADADRRRSLAAAAGSEGAEVARLRAEVERLAGLVRAAIDAGSLGRPGG